MCSGGDLHYHLSQHGVFSEKEMRFYAAEIILGLEHMHNRFVVYRDLKVSRWSWNAKVASSTSMYITRLHRLAAIASDGSNVGCELICHINVHKPIFCLLFCLYIYISVIKLKLRKLPIKYVYFLDRNLKTVCFLSRCMKANFFNLILRNCYCRSHNIKCSKLWFPIW